MEHKFLGFKAIFITFCLFFIGIFLILSGRSFFSLLSYQIGDIYHYFLFELNRPVNLTLINPNNLNSWQLYKSENREAILKSYLLPLEPSKSKIPTLSSLPNPVQLVQTILPEIFSSSTTTSRPTTKISTVTTISVASLEKNSQSWQALIAKYPNKNFVFIPQFNVQAPLLIPPSKNLSIIYNNLRKGVVLFPGSDKPGSGYSIILGHSSAYPWDPGDYRSVFSLLNELNYGDPFFVYYDGHIYAFKVVAKKTFIPLNKNNGLTTEQALPKRSKPTVVLQSCWPLGASTKRMAIQGELITED
ncbi:MAG TPA: sortase [Candidatus Paceibacterota bacterium]|nr:sortase [Candidatus Paceibacterota bacterium]